MTTVLTTLATRFGRLRLRFALVLRLLLVRVLMLMLVLMLILIRLGLVAGLIEPRLLIAVETAIRAVRVVALVVIAAALAIVILLAAVAMLPVLLLLFETRIQNPVIVIGMLEVILSKHAVSGRAGVAREREILLHELLRVAAHAPGAAVETTRAATAAPAHRTRTFAAITAALTALHIVRFVHQLSRFPWK
jgi:hypothetical protein